MHRRPWGALEGVGGLGSNEHVGVDDEAIYVDNEPIVALDVALSCNKEQEPEEDEEEEEKEKVREADEELVGKSYDAI